MNANVKMLLATVVIIASASVAASQVIVREKNKEIAKCSAHIADMENKVMRKDMENMELENKIKELKDKIDNELKEKAELQKQLDRSYEIINQSMKVTSFNENDVTASSNANIIHLKRALDGKALKSLAGAFESAEEQCGVNAYFLMALTAQESEWGQSQRVLEQNNLTGFGIHKSADRGTTFDSKELCILRTADTIKNEYLTETGMYFNGVAISDINKRYSADKNWTKNIVSIAYELKEKAESR